MPGDPNSDERLTESLTIRFGDIYQEFYGHLPPDVPLEVVGLRARVAKPLADLNLVPAGSGSEEPEGLALRGERPVYFEASGSHVHTAFYDRYRLAAGDVITGPAVIEERETSIVVGPDARCRVDAAANIVIELEA